MNVLFVLAVFTFLALRLALRAMVPSLLLGGITACFNVEAAAYVMASVWAWQFVHLVSRVRIQMIERPGGPQ